MAAILKADFGGAAIVQIGYTIYDAAGAAIGGRVTAGIVTLVAGRVFQAAVSLTKDMKTIIWDNGAGLPAVEDLSPYVAVLYQENRRETDPNDGLLKVYQDDGSTVFKSGAAWSSVAAAPGDEYSGDGVERVDGLA